ncbi:unnamed protein product [Symbiodinium natans]|uniref:Uncharacterized protein n=1 Tax=Symbiodinium natans TaxID=878477 RepID=A0A812UL89_9DINO|nr:unnamed protein product [Symbiodinium natans]
MCFRPGLAIKVKECFQKEAERLARQKQMAGPFGWLGDAFGFGADMCGLGLLSDKGEVSLQQRANHSSDFVVAAVCGGMSAGSAIMDAVNGGIEKVHDAENFAADDCNRMAAEMTLEKLEGIEQTLGDVQGQITDVENMVAAVGDQMRVNHAETKQMLTSLANQVREGQEAMRQIETNLDNRLLAISRNTATLSAKLDLLSNKLSKSMEEAEAAHYRELLARFSAAAAVIRGAYEDIVESGRNIDRHNARLTLPVVSSGLSVAKEESVSLQARSQEQLQNSWGRARDAFADLTGILSEGGLLYLHFKLLLQAEATDWVNTREIRTVFLEMDAFITEMTSKLDGDYMLARFVETMMYMDAMLESYLARFPNYETIGAYLQNLDDFKNNLAETKVRLAEDSLRATILEAPMLGRYRPLDSCAAAAFRYGIVDTMARWRQRNVATENSVLVIPSKLLHGEDGAIFHCNQRSPTVNSNVIVANFNPAPTDWTDQISSPMQHNGRTTDVLTIDCGEDYVVDGTSVRSAKAQCSCRTQESSPPGCHANHGCVLYKVTWTCNIHPSGPASSLKCKLKSEAPQKTVTKTSPPSHSVTKQIGSDGQAFTMLTTYLERLTAGLLTKKVSGEKCYRIGENGLGIKVGNNFVQIGKWRLAMINSAHFSLSHSEGQTPQIWRSDGTMHPGPRTDWGSWGWAEGVTLTSLSMDTSQYGVFFGDRFIQVGNWRFGQTDPSHFTISVKNPNGQVRTVQIFRRDGLVVTLGPPSEAAYNTWGFHRDRPQGISFGDHFLQIAGFRLSATADANGDAFTISHTTGVDPKSHNTAKTIMAYRKAGTHYVPGAGAPQRQVSTFARPACQEDTPNMA